MIRKVFLCVALIFGVGIVGLLLFYKFEGEVPSVNLTPKPSAIGRQTTLMLGCEDRRSGLKEVRVELVQQSRAVTIFDERYTSGTKRVQETLALAPLSLGLQDGTALFRVEVRDHSWRPGGNRNIVEATVTIDTRPPNVRVLSRFHYVNQGGAGLVVYQSPEKLAKTGVQVGDFWFPGYRLKEGGYLTFFAVPHDAPNETSIMLVSDDLAGNRSRTSFLHRVKPSKFRKDTIRVSDGFLRKVMPYFTDRYPSLQGDLPELFLQVNRNQRKTDDQKIRELCRQSDSHPLWSGPFLRMEDARKMAGFADYRIYTYGGKEIDRQYHLGVDLASLAMSRVKAANRGKVVFAGELGIYGNTILLDHGCGLFSMYGHLSQIVAQRGQIVEKGQPIGVTGTTGLTGGDHLHFSMVVSGVFVNPIEWWDPHWIKDNVGIKLALLRSFSR